MVKKFINTLKINHLEDFQKVYIDLKKYYQKFNHIQVIERKQPERSFIGLRMDGEPVVSYSLRSPDLVKRLLPFITSAKAELTSQTTVQEMVESTPQTYYSHDFTTLVDQIIERKNDLAGLVELIESLEDLKDWK